MLTGSSEGGTHTERKEREKGRRNTVKQEIMEGGMNEETRVCACKIAGEENGEEGSVNEVTYLLIGNELRLRVVNESVQVSSFLLVNVCISQGIGGQRWRIKEMQKKTNTSLESELREGAAFLKHVRRKKPRIHSTLLKDKKGLPKISLAGFSEM